MTNTSTIFYFNRENVTGSQPQPSFSELIVMYLHFAGNLPLVEIIHSEECEICSRSNFGLIWGLHPWWPLSQYVHVLDVFILSLLWGLMQTENTISGEIHRVFGKDMLDYVINLVNNKIDFIVRLPESCLIEIIRFLPLEDIMALSHTCKLFHRVSFLVFLNFDTKNVSLRLVYLYLFSCATATCCGRNYTKIIWWCQFRLSCAY